MKKIFLNFFLLFVFVSSCLSQIKDPAEMKKFLQNSYSYHMNIMLNAGAGFSNVGTGIITNDGSEIKISPGGGIGLGLQLGYTLDHEFDFSVAAMIQLSVMDQPVTNANGMFTRVLVEPMAKYLLRFSSNSKQSINAGIGADFSSNASLDINASSIPGGGEAIYNYKNAVGPVFMLEYLFRIKRIGFNAGLKYYSLNYYFKSGTYNGMSGYLTPAGLLNYNKIDGSGIDLCLGFSYYF